MLTLKQPSRETLLAAFDNTRAFSEGWALFNDGELQRLDEGSYTDERDPSGEPEFASDLEAYGYVCACAANGSQYHKSALNAMNPDWVMALMTEAALK